MRASVRHLLGTSLSVTGHFDSVRHSRNAGYSDKRPGEETLKLVPFVDQTPLFPVPGTPSATNQVFLCPDSLGEWAWFVATDARSGAGGAGILTESAGISNLRAC